MATWPAGLPQLLSPQGFQEIGPQILLKSEMDVGRPKRRRLATTGVSKFNASMIIEGHLPTPATAQRQVLFDFFYITLAAGSLPFDWVHPILQTSLEFYMDNLRIVPAGGTSYSASFELESTT